MDDPPKAGVRGEPAEKKRVRGDWEGAGGTAAESILRVYGWNFLKTFSCLYKRKFVYLGYDTG